MNVRIRPATAADAAFLAITTLIASRSHVNWGIFDVLFPRSEELRLRFVERMVTAEPRSFHHYVHFLVAEVGGQPAAALCAFTEDARIWDDLQQARTSVVRALGIDEDEWAAAEERAAPARALAASASAPIGAWEVEWVGTLPQYRRRGLVNGLLKAILEKGLRTGHSLAEVSVLIGNYPAQRAYEHAGFVTYEDYCSPEFEVLMRAPGGRKLRQML